MQSAKKGVKRFNIRTGVPRGRNTWEPDIGAKVQASLFDTVAMIVAASAEAEVKLMDAIAAAKAGKLKFPAA